MSTLVLSHPASLDHLVPSGHPERPDRLRAIERALAAERFKPLVRELAPKTGHAAIARCHPETYIEAIEATAPTEGIVRLDGDTSMSQGTLEAVLRAAGGAVAAVDAVMQGRVANAFVATRPPGHHAETATPMGFCLFNNAAIAVRHAQAQHGAARVALIDFDVHHGNGSQDIFWDDASVLYCSTHQMPLFPGTGAKRERGEHDTIVNEPLPPGSGSEDFRAAMESVILPRVREFRPDLLVLSAGFDAHERDPLANINLTEEDFAWVTNRLMDAADESAGGRIVSVLEGGYDLQALETSVAAHVATLMQGTI